MPQDTSYLFISGHDCRSRRKANMHFIAREFAALGRVNFFSLGFSYISLLKKDPRLSLWKSSNKIEYSEGVGCYLWRSLWHPVHLRVKALAWLEPWLFRWYVRRVPDILRQWIAEANVVVLESGMPIILFDLIKAINPATRIIYICSDALETIGCSAFLTHELQRVALKLEGIRIPSHLLAKEFPAGSRLAYVPHGMDAENLQTDAPSPYPQEGIHAVSVGSMLFDSSFFVIAAELFPHITFHVIGGGRKSQGLQAHNIKVYNEMPFQETLAYIRHARFGIAPYEGDKVSPYLVDTSMKLLQFGAFGIPAVCPVVAAGARAGRFGYIPGDRESIARAIQQALDASVFQSQSVLSWAEVAQRILHPENYPDTTIASGI